MVSVRELDLRIGLHPVVSVPVGICTWRLPGSAGLGHAKRVRMCASNNLCIIPACARAVRPLPVRDHRTNVAKMVRQFVEFYVQASRVETVGRLAIEDVDDKQISHQNHLFNNTRLNFGVPLIANSTIAMLGLVTTQSTYPLPQSLDAGRFHVYSNLSINQTVLHVLFHQLYSLISSISLQG